MDAKKVLVEARVTGSSIDRAKRAKKGLGVRSEKAGMMSGGGGPVGGPGPARRAEA